MSKTKTVKLYDDQLGAVGERKPLRVISAEQKKLRMLQFNLSDCFMIGSLST